MLRNNSKRGLRFTRTKKYKNIARMRNLKISGTGF